MSSFESPLSAVRHCGSLVSVVLVAACGSVVPDSGTGSERTSTAREAIIMGTTVNNAATAGVVQVFSKHSICTGTLLQNDLVLTARHCVTTDSTITGPLDSDGQHYALSMGEQTITPTMAVDSGYSPSMDVALIYLQTFFQTGASANLAYGFRNPIWPLPDAWLQGASVTCEGYGYYTFPGSFDGILRMATLTVASTTTSNLHYAPNASGQILTNGDSGSTCFINGYVTGVFSTFTNDGTSVTGADCVGPELYRPWVQGYLSNLSGGNTDVATSQNVAADWMNLAESDASASNALVTVTPNYNPPGSPGWYLNHNIGVWYTGSTWAVFNQDAATMSPGPAFNVSIGGYTNVQTVTSSTSNGNSMRLTPTWVYSDPNTILIVTPNWNPPGHGGVYNNHPIGVWYDGSAWEIYNEDLAPMPIGASFNVRIALAGNGSLVHHASPSNVTLNWTVIDDPNLNGQPGAKVFVTHTWNPPGSSAAYVNHPIGVWYTGTNWAIFNQDGAAMPTTASFNVMVRP